MKIAPYVDASVGQDVAAAQPPIKVCIHVVRPACTDVRAMRAASALVEAGFEVTIVDVESDPSHLSEEDHGGVHMKHLLMPDWHTSKRFELWFFINALRTFILSILRLVQSQADVYHANDLTALPATYIAARLRRKPLIFEIYDLQFPVPETSIGFWRRSSRLLTCFHALVLPLCAGVIATSPLHAQEIRKHFHVPDVTLIRNVPRYQTVVKSDRLRQRLGLSPEVRIALYQGSLQPDRGLDKLVLAAAHLEQNIVIVMKGAGKGPTQAELEALIASTGVADRVRIMPPVPFSEYLEWTASADIGLIVHSPNYSLNVRTLLPNKLFEYLMAGVPVLSSPLEAVAEILSTYDVGQVIAPTAMTPAGIGAAINTMLANPVSLARMRQNGLEAAKSKFCWEKERQNLIGLYQEVCSKHDVKYGVPRKQSV
jgi:glycosyltransferase involved in cell wall biosynthesis